MIYNDIDALESILSMIISDMHPIDIREMAAQFPDDFTEAIEEFCDRYGLGNWFNESLILHEVDISDTLNRLADEAEIDAQTAESHRDEVERDYRHTIGQPA